MLNVIATKRLGDRAASILLQTDRGELYSLSVYVRDTPATEVAEVVDVEWAEAGECTVHP